MEIVMPTHAPPTSFLAGWLHDDFNYELNFAVEHGEMKEAAK